MKYVLIDMNNGDMFDEEFDTKEAAVKEANRQWGYLTEREKKNREAFYVLESINPDEEAENHYDGDVILDFKED